MSKMLSPFILEHELLHTDNSTYPKEKCKLRRMNQLVTTTKFTPPQPTTNRSPSPSSTRYHVNLCKAEDHDCTTMQHWTPFECKLWLAKIVHDSHALDFTEAYAQICTFNGDGLKLQAMTQEELMKILPKHYRLVCGQRQVLWNRCRACMVDAMNKKKVARLNDEQVSKAICKDKDER